jgi:acyl-CoA thioesterase-2
MVGRCDMRSADSSTGLRRPSLESLHSADRPSRSCRRVFPATQATPYSSRVPDDATTEFLSRLSVEPVVDDLFAGVCNPGWPGKAFGGQLAAQSVQAASATAPAGMVPWSLHVYFHAPIAANERIDYAVERIKDGRTTSARQVSLAQDGKLRVTAMVLFGLPGEGPEHGYLRPDTPSPSLTPPQIPLVDPTVLPPDADWASLGYPAEALVEVRVSHEHAGGEPADSRAFGLPVWMRVVPKIPRDAITVASAICYLSDITLGTTALEPHGGRAGTTELQLGAIELAFWFAEPAALNEWSLFSQESSFAGSGHGLSHGVFYNSEGRVSAIAVQNALMRFA